MAELTYLLIKRLDVTIPDSFIHTRVRTDFSNMVQQCPLITGRLLPDDFALPPHTGNKGLVPVGYHLLFDALTNSALRAALQCNSVRVGYWYFNLFILPAGSPIVANPSLSIIKGVTQGLDQIGSALTSSHPL